MRAAWDQVEPNELVWNWHMGAVCEVLEAVSSGEIRKLLINIPPGMSKSLLVSTLWPAWDWIKHPTRRFIYATYAQDLSNKNAILHRNLVLSDWYSARWPEMSLAKNAADKVREFHTAAGGWRYSTSTGGAVTGQHGNVLVFDDLVKAQDAEGRAIVDPLMIQKANDFWLKVMHTRRADSQTTARVGIMQRLHHEDTAAKCLEQGDYVHLNLPMEYDPQRHCVIDLGAGRRIEDPRRTKGELLNPARFPAEVVAEDKRVMGKAFEAQMNQNPTPLKGAIFEREWFKRVRSAPEGARKAIFVDCSFKDTKASDYVAIQCWAVKDPNFYLVDQIHDRFNVKKTMEMIAEMQDRHPGAIGIYVEDAANGPSVIQILQDMIPGLIAWSPHGASKISRAQAVAPLAESGNVCLVEGPWVEAYLAELVKFPLSLHDDQVDATSMALLTLHKPKHKRYRDAVKKMLGGG